ncbi:unnamed protein product [Tetraodon nigroviridis]|uniref:(spotted green pufferfish) hypothetical protein n=1 Tax=Tetraodon nigroviridis TaxID=99883 RepID=Q4SKS0_TETNG|nr:unnamed protein product [Tetraodon nigroviridis]
MNWQEREAEPQINTPISCSPGLPPTLSFDGVKRLLKGVGLLVTPLGFFWSGYGTIGAGKGCAPGTGESKQELSRMVRTT